MQMDDFTPHSSLSTSLSQKNTLVNPDTWCSAADTGGSRGNGIKLLIKLLWNNCYKL